MIRISRTPFKLLVAILIVANLGSRHRQIFVRRRFRSSLTIHF